MKDKAEYIFEKIPCPALYEQLAEEAAEMAHAALKMARIWRKENPTPVQWQEGFNRLTEEISDVMLVLDVLGLEKDQEIVDQKIDRWLDRIREGERKSHDSL